jgi:RNA polymerase sigma-70 factor (ECF subfamily)
MRRDEAAFAAVVDAYQGRLLRYVARLLANPSPAEDVVQRVLIKCAASWKGPMEPSDELAAWLYRVAHNEALDHVRRERRLGFLHRRHAEERVARGEDIARPEVGTGADAPGDEAAAAAEALRSLGDRDRLLVTLKVYEEKSYKEIAAITGMSLSNVGVTLHNAMKKLAERLRRPDSAGAPPEKENRP